MVKRTLLLNLLILFSLQVAVKASISIATRFGTVVLEGVEPGVVYNVTERSNRPFLVINRGTSMGNVQISVIRPQSPRSGYEAIADPNWLTVRPSEFELGPGESLPATIILTVPEDEAYLERHYHAMIRVDNRGEGMMGAAVVNNFFFSVGSPGPEAVQRAKAAEIFSELNYDLTPESLYIDIPAGEKINIVEQLGRSLQLVNRGRQDVNLVIESIKNTQGFSASAGYSFTPSPDFLWAEPEFMTIGSYQVRDINLFVEIPEEYKDEKLMFLVAVYPEEYEFAKFYSRVFINVN